MNGLANVRCQKRKEGEYVAIDRTSRRSMHYISLGQSRQKIKGKMAGYSGQGHCRQRRQWLLCGLSGGHAPPENLRCPEIDLMQSKPQLTKI